MRAWNRRQALTLLAAAIPLKAESVAPRISITMDDVAWAAIPQPYQTSASRKLLGALAQHGQHATLFVTGKNVDSVEGRTILQQWNDAGHRIANHTWSHRAYNASIAPAEFESDMLRCDRFVRTYPGFRPFFRFPALKEGTTAERRDQMRTFLRDHGYRNGAVTIDASDWYYDQRLRMRLAKDAGFDVNRYREPYLAHILDRAGYYDALGRKVLGRAVAHTLLLHFNLLNVLFLGDVLRMLMERGWTIVDSEAAYRDPVFQLQPDTVPAGESLIWALAKQTGRFDSELRHPGEDDVYEKPGLDRLGL